MERPPVPPTSTCWSSGPASPASTSCTGRSRPGFTARLLEAGDGVGGTWYWNRYPGARFDSESYTYGYLFSKELFDEWEWQEHFAAQPETERYLNHVVDRFDLRRAHPLRRQGRPRPSSTRRRGRWTVRRGDGTERPGPLPRRRHRRALGAVLPRRPGPRRLPRRGRTTPAAGRPTPVDFAGKRVAVDRHRRRAACRSSRPSLDDVAAAHRVPAHRQLVHPAQQRARSPPEEQAQLRADFERSARR